MSFDQLTVPENDARQVQQRPAVKPPTVRDGNLWTQPEFRFAVALLGVDVDGFTRVALIREEVETYAIVAENNGHGSMPP